ncbi:hypothetical protein ACKI1H_07950 [Pseudomonas sp. YH-1]|uniref:hypothetical protein n=1 Tax=Pseudomonas sp. YH-1 TaxID=3384787 RepID=UPI003F7E19BA
MSEQPCEKESPILVVKIPQVLSKQAAEMAEREVEQIAQRLGMRHILVCGGSDAHVESDLRPLLSDLVAEQRKTNQLLTALITAMAEEDGGDGEPDPIIPRDLAGRPIGLRRGPADHA